MLQDRRTAHLNLVELSTRRRLLAFLGPATLVSVGYMDPGNWATDLEGGARFGHQLLWVLAFSSFMALLLQTLAARPGVVTGLDLAQACRASYSKSVNLALWIIAELAIVACDMAEVLGSAIALNLLFNIPMIWGAILTVLDVFLILALQRRGVRALEATVLTLILTIAICLAVETWLVKPSMQAIASGLIPSLRSESLYVAIGIIGATVMPHNLYLHSALVKTRDIEPSFTAKKEALRYYFFDTALALNIAMVVNMAILILSATAFGNRGIEVTDIREAYHLLTPLLGTAISSTLFAVALLAAGQSSTITGTFAGQIVMEGFVNLRLPPIWRRMLTRLLALIPAVAALAWFGEGGTLPLLIASQIVLSLQLPFAVIPLVRFTSSSALMGRFVSPFGVKIIAALCATFLLMANGALMVRTMSEWSQSSTIALWIGIVIALSIGLLLTWIGFVPLRGERYIQDSVPLEAVLARCGNDVDRPVP